MSSIGSRRYKNLGRISTLPYTNGSDAWLVIVGVSWSLSLTTQAAGASESEISVTDGAGNTIDSIVLGATQSATSPTSTVTQYLVQLTHKMLVPPQGQIVSTGGRVQAVQVIQANDTTAQDGRDSLENALLVST